MDNVVTFSGLDVGACLPKTVSCDPLCKAREQYSHFPSPSRQHVFFLKKKPTTVLEYVHDLPATSSDAAKGFDLGSYGLGFVSGYGDKQLPHR